MDANVEYLANHASGVGIANELAIKTQISAAWWGLQTNVSGLASLTNISGAVRAAELALSGVIGAHETSMKTFVSGAVRANQLAISGLIAPLSGNIGALSGVLGNTLVTGINTTATTANADGSVIEREEYIQTLISYGARLLTEDTGGSTSVIDADEITEAAGWWKGALVIGLTGHNIGVARTVIRNSVGSLEVSPNFPEANVASDTYILISALKPQTPELQAAEAISIFLSGGAAAANVLNLATSGFSYRLDHLRLKSENPLTQTVSVKLYELINGTSTEVTSFTINSANFATYFSMMDMFGVPHLAGDNLKVTAACTSGATSGVNLTGQYSHSKIYTGTG